MITFPKPRKFVTGQTELRTLSLSAVDLSKAELAKADPSNESADPSKDDLSNQPKPHQDPKPRHWRLVPPWRWM